MPALRREQDAGPRWPATLVASAYGVPMTPRNAPASAGSLALKCWSASPHIWFLWVASLAVAAC